MILALTMLGGATACGGTEYNDAELMNKISGLETQITDIQTDLGGQINDLQNALDGYLAEEETNPNALASNYAAEAYEMVKYIGKLFAVRKAK